MRVLVIASDLLDPPLHGGRVEMRNGLRSLAAVPGLELDVVATAWQRAQGEEFRSPDALPVTVVRRNFRNALWNARLPLLVGTRSPKLTPHGNYDVVLAHTEFVMPLARCLAPGAPIVVRSHNDEPAYLAALAASTNNSVRRLYYSLESRRLERYSAQALPSAAAVLAISKQDADTLARMVRAKVLRPFLFDGEGAGPSRRSARKSNLLFVGNLFLPNNQTGLRWFLANVWPALTDLNPAVTLTVCGSAPPAAFQQELAEAGADVWVNVPDLDPYYDNAALFINPVLAGSGVNIKVGEPLRRGIPVISTSTGARGLEDMVGLGLIVEDDGPTQAVRIHNLLRDEDAFEEASGMARRSIEALYDPGALALELANELRKACGVY